MRYGTIETHSKHVRVVTSQMFTHFVTR